MKKMPTKDFLRNIFTGMAGVGAMVVLQAQYQHHVMPDPEEYMDTQSFPMSMDQRRVLQSLSNVRVIESGSWTKKIYCLFNQAICRYEEKSGSPAMYNPVGIRSWVGATPVIFVQSADVRKEQDMISRFFKKKMINPAYTDEITFRFAFYHEAGHAWLEKNDPELQKELTYPQMELHADLFALGLTPPEDIEITAKFNISLRSLHYQDGEHDISLVLQDIVDDVEPAYQEGVLALSREGFELWGEQCATQAAKNGLKQNNLDAMYDCRAPLPETDFTALNGLLVRRYINFIEAYQDFFIPRSSGGIAENEIGSTYHAQPRP